MRASSRSALNISTVTNSIQPDDLSREVYGLLGIPIDVTDLATVVHKIEAAAASVAPFLISTSNLNFLVMSQFDPDFRESLLQSDLGTVDGISIFWTARLLGVPVNSRITGVDIFEALKSAHVFSRRIKVFLFGGPEGVAATACNKLNDETNGQMCAGSFYPGFCTVEEMSTDSVINIVNSSNADFLAVALGAVKGQAWLLKNQDAITIPIRAHLGATINYQAGALKRAPESFQMLGLEWLWRIKEEPLLWKRYSSDALELLTLVLTRVIPLMVVNLWQRLKVGHGEQNLLLRRTEDHKSVILSINGAATALNVREAALCFREAIAAAKDVVINFADTSVVDTRFIGLILMLSKQLKKQRRCLKFIGVPPHIERIFRLNGFGFLLSA